MLADLNRELSKKQNNGSIGVFLDRDGVINALLYHKDVGIIDSPFTIRQFRVLPRAPQAIRRLNDLGLPVVIVSNQPGVAKRHFSAQTLAGIDKKLGETLRHHGARVEGIYYCLHHPDAAVQKLRRRCRCRKPGVGLLRLAARELGLSLRRSYMVGDGLTDIEAGSKAGCTTIFVGSWKCEHGQFIRPKDLRPDFMVKDLWEASEIISLDLLHLAESRRFPAGERKNAF